MAIKPDEEIRKEVSELFSQNPILQDLLREAKVQAAGKTEDLEMEDELDALASSLDEWYLVLAITEKHMGRLFGELGCITDLISKFSRELYGSGVETKELEHQVGVISALLHTLVSRVNILCEDEIKDMNSQLDIVRVKRSYWVVSSNL